jgi:hypothetical protein
MGTIVGTSLSDPSHKTKTPFYISIFSQNVKNPTGRQWARHVQESADLKHPEHGTSPNIENSVHQEP